MKLGERGGDILHHWCWYKLGRERFERNSCIQGNLRIMDTLGASILSIVQRLSLLRRYGQYIGRG